MVLKADWEKTQEVVSIAGETIREIVQSALPERLLLSYEIISGGCANINSKLIFQDNQQPLILRIYIRDKTAGVREQKIAALGQGVLPIPLVHKLGTYGDYHYALVEYVEGQTLRDILLAGTENTDEVVAEAGKALAAFQQYIFPHAGFFDANFQLVPHNLDCRAFLEERLAVPHVQAQLGEGEVKRILHVLERHGASFPDDSLCSLVHADYDPANIWVVRREGKWKIAAILDWEFAFSGSYLCDVANMLRYAHQLPASYEQSFLRGIKEAGVVLPDNWQVSIRLLNVLSLLDCLARVTPATHPAQCRDIIALLAEITQWLERE